MSAVAAEGGGAGQQRANRDWVACYLVKGNDTRRGEGKDQSGPLDLGTQIASGAGMRPDGLGGAARASGAEKIRGQT
jgi:hypothetical protein